MREVLLLVDVIKAFEHEDGNRLLASYRARHHGMASALASARSAKLPVVYVNDNGGVWNSDAPGLIARAVRGKGGDFVAALRPRDDEPFILKPRQSGFDDTPLARHLSDLGIADIVLAGTATELCVFQTAIDALRNGFGVSIRTDACATVDEEHERLALEYLRRVLGVNIL
jgi:nicotinamidase-related amidase